MLNTGGCIARVGSAGVVIISIDRRMHDLSCERQAGVIGAGVVIVFDSRRTDLRETAAAEIQDAIKSHLRIIGNGRAAAARAAGIADFTAGTGVAVVASGAITRLGIADSRP